MKQQITLSKSVAKKKLNTMFELTVHLTSSKMSIIRVSVYNRDSNILYHCMNIIDINVNNIDVNTTIESTTTQQVDESMDYLSQG